MGLEEIICKTHRRGFQSTLQRGAHLCVRLSTDKGSGGQPRCGSLGPIHVVFPDKLPSLRQGFSVALESVLFRPLNGLKYADLVGWSVNPGGPPVSASRALNTTALGFFPRILGNKPNKQESLRLHGKHFTHRTICPGTSCGCYRINQYTVLGMSCSSETYEGTSVVFLPLLTLHDLRRKTISEMFQSVR